MLFIFLILAAIVLAQPSPPALGIQIGSSAYGSDIRFPLAVTQCEPVFIYYHAAVSDSFISFFSGSHDFLFAILPIPTGDPGYFEWVCNIPAGYNFLVTTIGFSVYYYIVVQPGPLSSCLHNVTTTYQYASYSTVPFASYTARPPSTTTAEADALFAILAT